MAERAASFDPASPPVDGDRRILVKQTVDLFEARAAIVTIKLALGARDRPHRDPRLAPPRQNRSTRVVGGCDEQGTPPPVRVQNPAGEDDLLVGARRLGLQ